MSILDGKQVLKPYIKKTTGYIKSLLSSQHVEMKDGKTLQTTVEEIDNNLTYLKLPALTILLESGGNYGAGKIPLLQKGYSANNTNNYLIHNNGEIKIGAGVKTIVVSGGMFVTTKTATQYLWGRIDLVKANGTVLELQKTLDSTTTQFAALCFSPYIQNVEEGDSIRLVKINSEQETLRSEKNTWLTVQALEMHI